MHDIRRSVTLKLRFLLSISYKSVSRQSEGCQIRGVHIIVLSQQLVQQGKRWHLRYPDERERERERERDGEGEGGGEGRGQPAAEHNFARVFLIQQKHPEHVKRNRVMLSLSVGVRFLFLFHPLPATSTAAARGNARAPGLRNSSALTDGQGASIVQTRGKIMRSFPPRFVLRAIKALDYSACGIGKRATRPENELRDWSRRKEARVFQADNNWKSNGKLGADMKRQSLIWQ
ncbi:hypothetical protein ALC56_11384 [Trachymyrmex septentrionalis]|uniref:Uncharacterized protein n=1 Tax=Trachymyrmex septentrionalis TaxID=34720 RepID=A0A195F275_9HYME|nr:hypothetical protein ALC56_11384 [Trachymyrmex septentrionalis]